MPVLKTFDVAEKDVRTLIASLAQLEQSLRELRRATMCDADRGYQALVFKGLPETLHPDDRAEHPWYNKKRPIIMVSYHQHELVLAGIEAIWFTDREDSRRTYDFPSLVISSMKTLDAVKKVNLAKQQFKSLVVSLKKIYRGLSDADIESALSPRGQERAMLSSVHTAFLKAGLARICVKQVYRPIHYNSTLGLVRAKYYRKPVKPGRQRTVSKQLETFKKQRKKGDESEALLNAIQLLNTMPGDQIIRQSQNSSDIITINYKIPSVAKENKYHWSQATGVLPFFSIGQPIDDVSEFVDFTALDTLYKERALSTQKSTRTSKWETKAFIPKFHLYKRSHN